MNWTRTDLRLPEPLADVLIALTVAGGETCVDVGYLDGSGAWHYTGGERIVCWPVTHWMELPAPPAEMAA